VTCASPVGQYVDPTCSVLYPGDASVETFDAASGVDSGADAGTDGGADAAADLDAADGSRDGDEDEDASG
jgi:hypothetical protein